MKAELKRLHSPDVDDLKSFRPVIKDCFSFLLQIMVGQSRLDGEESFDAMVCTPKWLLTEYKNKEILFLRHFIIVFEYDYEKLLFYINKKIESIDYDIWDEFGKKFGEVGRWEFENYS